MGLLKDKDIAGNTYKYWSISRINKDYKNRYAQVFVDLWASQDYKIENEDAEPVQTIEYVFSDGLEQVPDFPFIEEEMNKEKSNDFVVGYAAVKDADPGFSDVLEENQEPPEIELP